MTSKACDDCHRKKERCRFDRGAKVCRLCANQGMSCTFVRQRRRMGRPPTAKPLPYGSCDVISFDDEEDKSSAKSSPPEQVSVVQLITTNRQDPDSDKDGAIKILEAFTRRFLHPARAKSVMNPERFQLVQQVLCNKASFIERHGPFMVGPSFADGFRTAILKVVTHLHGVLIDAYQSAFGVWDTRVNAKSEPSELDLSIGADCLKHLQSTLMMSAEDAAALIMLGQILAVYHMVAMSASPHTIVRSSLHMARNWYPTLLGQPQLLPLIITPVLWDTVECLVRREIPVVQIPYMDSWKPDRSMGISTCFLPILYDLCVVSHRTNAMQTPSGSSPSQSSHSSPSCQSPGSDGDWLAQVEYRIQCWEPVMPSKMDSEFTLLEISAMLMHARLYRKAALLIVHRLRYPLGVEDEPAKTIATGMAAELMSYMKWAPDDMIGLAVGFPLALALLELEGPVEKQLYDHAPPMFYPNYVESVSNFVRSARSLRDDGYTGLWFDLVGNGADLTVIP